MSPGEAGLFIDPPFVMQRLTVRILATRRVEGNCLLGIDSQFNWASARLSVYNKFRVVVCVSKVLDRPIHSRGEVVLIGLAPAPDRRLI